MTDEIKALIAIPAKIILSEEIKFVNLFPKPFDKLKIIVVVTIAKRNETGVMIKNGRLNGRIKIRIAPRPAPAEIPSRPGSAKLLRSIDCKIIPEQDKDAPTIMAFKILGSLISRRILLFCPSLSEKIFNSWEKLIEMLPANKEINITTIRAKKRRVSIRTFLDNN